MISVTQRKLKERVDEGSNNNYFKHISIHSGHSRAQLRVTGSQHLCRSVAQVTGESGITGASEF